MDISDPVVANCLIDQHEVECVMLIPTSNEAADIMSDASKVPRNCKRAFTQQGDTFFPDPHYRSYGGPRNLKSKFLQVSVRDTIKYDLFFFSFLSFFQTLLLNLYSNVLSCK